MQFAIRRNPNNLEHLQEAKEGEAHAAISLPTSGPTPTLFTIALLIGKKNWIKTSDRFNDDDTFTIAPSLGPHVVEQAGRRLDRNP